MQIGDWFALVVGLSLGAWLMPAMCPRGYYVDGVTLIGPDIADPTIGEFRCHRVPARRVEEDRPINFHPMQDLPGEDYEYHARIYCTGGTRPIVVNEHTVGCQPGGYR